MSLTAWLGVYYEFILWREEHVRKDKDGRLVPREYFCQMRMTLKTKNVSLQKRPKLDNPMEQDRDDVWWVDPEGRNIEAVLSDIRKSFLETGVPWLNDMTDLENVLEKVRAERDCREKYWRAMYLAQRLGLSEESKRYRTLYEEKTRQLDELLRPSNKKRAKRR
jgi:hypothetical protein